MKNVIFLLTIAFGVSFITSCKKDETPDTIDYEYHAHINSPSTDAKSIGDTLHIDVDFESHTGEKVHHINVKVYDKADNTVVFDEPSEAHIHSAESMYNFHEHIDLTTANGFASGADYVLEAKVWGEEDDDGEEVSTVEFSIN